MKRTLLIFAILFFTYNVLAQNVVNTSISHHSDTSTHISRLWLHSYDKEVDFFNRLNTLRYEDYPNSSEDYDEAPVGYMMCYTSKSFLEKAEKEFQKLGLPSIDACMCLKNDKGPYLQNIEYLRSFIDTDAYLHSDDEFPYALTNSRGIALFDIELYATEFIMSVAISQIIENDRNQLLKYHKTILNCFRFWFTISYEARGIMQMSGLTGDTYRACWPYLRLYNEILHQAVVSEDYENLFSVYRNIIPFISYHQTISHRNYNEELLHSLSDESVGKAPIFNSLYEMNDIDEYKSLLKEIKDN